MKHEILLIFLLATAIVLANGALANGVQVKSVQANDVLPYSSIFDDNQLTSATVTPEKPFGVNNSSTSQQNGYFYRQQPYGNYSFRPVQYPLFYYLPEIKEARLRLSGTPSVKEFHDINDILNQKTEQAIRRNESNQEILVATPATLNNEMNLSGSDLSEITAASLIVSARKQQFLETLIPELLNNQRLFLQDRERLQKLFNDFKTSKRITSSDEIWLQKLSEMYDFPSLQSSNSKIDHGIGTNSQYQ